jgi:hypothetical protein
MKNPFKVGSRVWDPESRAAASVCDIRGPVVRVIFDFVQVAKGPHGPTRITGCGGHHSYFEPLHGHN